MITYEDTVFVDIQNELGFFKDIFIELSLATCVNDYFSSTSSDTFKKQTQRKKTK